MNLKRANAVWAIVLIGLGGLLLAQNFGYLDELSWQVWAAIFAGLSVLFLVTYLLSGIRNWGWLFPALILGALAGMLVMGMTGRASAALVSPLMLAIGAPFVVAFALSPRENWWALIPAWVMGVLGGLMLVVDRAAGELIGALLMFAVGAPFLIAYLINRSRWWALIPGGVLVAMGLVILLSTRATGQVIGTLVLLLIALPFLAVYAAGPDKNWWALIPAGVLASVALLVFLAAGRDVSPEAGARLSGVLFLGSAVTFSLLWLQRATAPTAWAIYPAGALAALALLAFVLGSRLEVAWPLVLIGVGLLLLALSLRPRRSE